jgi:AraC-like DNA-binding protein
MDLMPAANVIAVLDGMSALGLDVARLRREASIPRELGDPEALVPAGALDALWERAFALAPRDELVIEIGLHIPLGAFGAMDYLAASADTVGRAFDSLALHFSSMVPGHTIEIDSSVTVYRVRFLHDGVRSSADWGDDLTVAIMVSHFRAHTAALPLERIALRRKRPSKPERFVELLGAPVTFGHRFAALEFAPEAPEVPLTSKDPLLRRTLESMSSRLGLARQAPSLETLVRARLRNSVDKAPADAAGMAKAMGMSERTLHRKLAELGRSYRDIVDDVRRGEAERLLLTNQSNMAEVALALGFADQSAFSRAFKRWTNLTPREWKAQQIAGRRART